MLVDPSSVVRPFEVLKFRVGVPMRVLVCSPCLGVNTHFLGSTRICAGENCPACLAGIPSKYQGYIVILYDCQRRLMRLTAASAKVGSDQGMFTPGRIIEVEKERERRPVRLLDVGDLATFAREQIVSRIELLSVLARLHGLPPVPDGAGMDDALDLVACAARTNLRLAMKGQLA